MKDDKAHHFVGMHDLEEQIQQKSFSFLIGKNYNNESKQSRVDTTQPLYFTEDSSLIISFGKVLLPTFEYICKGYLVVARLIRFFYKIREG